MKASNLLNTTSEIEITNITNNSSEIKAGGLYFALIGITVDGHDYIEEAIENGAVAIVHTEDVYEKEGIIYEKVDNMHIAYNTLASKFWGNPADNLKIIGTTGTNGKSSTSWIIDDILNTVSSSGYIGTIGIKTGEKIEISPFTTLLPHQYNQIFAKMVQAKKEYATIEVSSQGLDQHRTDFIKFDYAIMTNLTHDHIDYHKTMKNYLKAKSILFRQIKKTGKAIINNDDNSADYLKSVATGHVITYGVESECDVRATNIKLFSNKTIFTLLFENTEYLIETNLIGLFNVYNLLAALAVSIDIGIPIEKLMDIVKNLSQIEGRMEIVENNKGLNIIVDYAHTPDGFEQVFSYVNTITTGKIISVFGAAGERDFVKRPVLGEIADKNSDYIVLTEEDCLGEAPKAIANQITKGIVNTKYVYIENREEAIEHAFSHATSGDSIVVLSKGQEKFQKRKNGKEPYDGDIAVCQKQLDK